MKTENTTTAKLTIEEVLKNGNSIVNQNIKSQFVQKHVYLNVNSMVEYILRAGFEDRNAPFTIDDIENYYSYPEYRAEFADFEGGTRQELDNEIEDLKALKFNHEEDNDTETAESIQEEIEKLENLESEAQEVFEWYAVSSFLAEKLSQKGECIIDSDNIWGRTTTGQAVLLDYVITKICAEMEILEGQSNSWEEKR
ncbi:MAG: hypothetical protein V4549_07730 [Bacteroidota bacterium]